ncbi:hypothetical protein BD410DRAFT_717576 [Rickenella mellea]|uniref:RING-type domain-containing protein n=1 Tax=Rickenella mellea TaxID=50990 RepID=A0A4Y7QDY0_9AGAM|nr:hypothetical protein BD410DRAFT_717576 [Rickenella mellea]
MTTTEAAAATEQDALPLPLTTQDSEPPLLPSLTSSITTDSWSQIATLASSSSTEATRPPPKKRRRTPRNEAYVINNVDDIDDSGGIVGTSGHSEEHDQAVEQVAASTTSTPPDPEPLSNYLCPICFSPPTNATLTPCGHVCCGECLFTAVRTTLHRAIAHASPEPPLPRCPVCRAELKGWDGRGGGVIGLKVRTVFTL